MIAYKADFKYKNDVQLVDTIMYLFSKTVLNKELSNKEVIVLREYVLNGYSKQTKNSLLLELNIQPQTLNTMNYHLKNKGFLRPHPQNQRLKLLNEKLLELKEFIEDPDNDKVFMVDFGTNKRDVPQ